VPVGSPTAAAAAALDQYDTNHDGSIAGPELDKSPGLKSALPTTDADRDGKLTATEIAARLSKYRSDEIPTFPVLCQVMLDGRPLAGAEVRMVPEPFLGDQVKSASSITDADGATSLKMDGATDHGVHCGLFVVQISKKDAAGKETVPAKYNAQSTLGQEVARDVRAIEDGVTFNLSSR
jgi:hypothetical protein